MNPPVVIGWRERMDFVDWEIHRARVKIDTGARTSAIDAIIRDIRLRADGKSTIVFALRRGRATGARAKVVEAPLLGTTRVRSSIGESAERYLIETTICLGPVTKKIQLTIADRCRMLVPVILGRSALGNDFLVDVSRKYVLTA